MGKTYSILEFGRICYENVAYFNFETNPRLGETFEEDISPDYPIPIFSHVARQTLVREKTLIVFDEVQLCERALTSLKYFCEDAPDYHIIAAGGLLGVAVNRSEFSFPVGKVDMKTLYPMDMEEFMIAMGEKSLAEQIKKPLENYRDIDAFKIYVSDMGLLCAKKELSADDILYMVEEINDFKGGMAENYVNLQLTINGYKTCYWESERGAEFSGQASGKYGGGKLSGALCAGKIGNRKNDIYLLCSDGLCGILKKEKMMEYILQKGFLRKCCVNLVKGAVAAGSEDNVTAILVQCE